MLHYANITTAGYLSRAGRMVETSMHYLAGAVHDIAEKADAKHIVSECAL